MISVEGQESARSEKDFIIDHVKSTCTNSNYVYFFDYWLYSKSTSFDKDLDFSKMKKIVHKYLWNCSILGVDLRMLLSKLLHSTHKCNAVFNEAQKGDRKEIVKTTTFLALSQTTNLSFKTVFKKFLQTHLYWDMFF